MKEASFIELPDPSEKAKHFTLAVDAGLRHTGLAWKEGGVYRFTQLENECEIFAFVPLNAAQMICDFARKVSGKKPVFLVVEDFAFGGTFNVQQGELIGALKQMVWDDPRFIGISFVAPNTAKKLLTGNGRATKGKVKKAVEALISEKIVSSHMADAVAIHYSYSKMYNNPSPSMFRRALIKR